MADPTAVIRVKLDMRKSNPGASLMAWMVVDPSEISSVKQLTKLVKRRFLLVGEHRLYLDGAWLPPVECIRVLRDNDVISVVWGECDSEKTSSAPNCVVQNGGVKRHLEEPDLLPPKKKKKKKPRYQSLSAEEIPAVLDIIEYQAAGTTISAEAVAEATQPATPVKPCLQTTQNDSSCSDSEAVVKFPNKSPPESRLQGDLDTAAGSVTELSSFVTPDGPKKKRPRKRKKKPKVAASVEPTVNLTPAVFVPLKVSVEPKGKHKRFEHESHWDEMEAEGVERKEADDRGQGEADDGMQGGAENGGQNNSKRRRGFCTGRLFHSRLTKNAKGQVRTDAAIFREITESLRASVAWIGTCS
ncbi:coilin [Ixodes scapularis]